MTGYAVLVEQRAFRRGVGAASKGPQPIAQAMATAAQLRVRYMDAPACQILRMILSILLARCAGSTPGGWVILEVLVHMAVLLALSLSADSSSLRLRGTEARLPAGF